MREEKNLTKEAEKSERICSYSLEFCEIIREDVLMIRPIRQILRIC